MLPSWTYVSILLDLYYSPGNFKLSNFYVPYRNMPPAISFCFNYIAVLQMVSCEFGIPSSIGQYHLPGSILVVFLLCILFCNLFMEEASCN